MPSIGATCGVFGVDGSLWKVVAPPSPSRTRSVKVPPTSMPIRARAMIYSAASATGRVVPNITASPVTTRRKIT